MALIKCPECGKEISDTAKNCIHCGYALKEENNAETPQTVVHIEAPKKGKSSKNFLVIGITLNLCCLLFTTLSTIGSSKAVNPFRDNKIMLIILIVAAVISLVYSLVLLAKPDLRNVKTTIPYMIINLLAGWYTLSFFNKGDCAFMTLVPHLGLLFVSYVLIFISLFIKDEKQ